MHLGLLRECPSRILCSRSEEAPRYWFQGDVLLKHVAGFSRADLRDAASLALPAARAYIGLAIVAALGPFAVVVTAGADAAFHASGFIAGGALLATAAWVRLLARR